MDRGGNEKMNKEQETFDKMVKSISYHIKDLKEREKFLKEVGEKLKHELGTIDEKNLEDSLLDYLMSEGLFPTFAFPLNVAKFEVLGTKKEKMSKFSKEYTYAKSSQDLKVALSEFTPGRTVVINKQSFKIEGLGVDYPENPIDHMEGLHLDESHLNEDEEIKDWAKEVQFYNRCEEKNCGTVFKSVDADYLIKEQKCEVCEAAKKKDEELPMKLRSTRIFEPKVFRPLMYPHDDNNRTMSSEGQAKFINDSEKEMKALEAERQFNFRTKTGRAKLPTPISDDDKEEEIIIKNITKGDFGDVRVLRLGSDSVMESGTKLLMVNAGPEEEGFIVCSKCGNVDLENKYSGKNKLHYRPYAITGKQIWRHPEILEKNDPDEKEKKFNKLKNQIQGKCSGEYSQPIILGHVFRTDVVIFRMKIKEPLSVNWNTNAFISGIKAIREALITGATEVLELIESEISGNFRKITIPNNEGEYDMFIDFFLYDSVSGGAGLVKQINREKSIDILDYVDKKLNGYLCTGGTPCDRICTGCLIDFRNKIEQGTMNRVIGNQMFQFFKNREAPDFNNVGFQEPKTSLTDSLLDSLRVVYGEYSFNDYKNFVEVTNSKNEIRKFKMSSIISGTSMIDSNNILWDKTKIYRKDLDKKTVIIPYELIRDSPHMIKEILFPPKEKKMLPSPKVKQSSNN